MIATAEKQKTLAPPTAEVRRVAWPFSAAATEQLDAPIQAAPPRAAASILLPIAIAERPGGAQLRARVPQAFRYFQSTEVVSLRLVDLAAASLRDVAQASLGAEPQCAELVGRDCAQPPAAPARAAATAALDAIV